ncbi:hypothetical protein Tco_0767775 [Tanacetum coccineum]
MSTSKTYQQSLAEAGSETRPPMLERGSYIPWASRFKRFLNRKRENQKWLLKALEDGPYVFRNITPTGSMLPRLQEVEDLQGDDLLYYDAEMELTNMILLSIPNEIYNSVDSCKTAKEMWDRVERLMRGTIQNQVDRETRFTNEFDQFVAEPGESLVSVYNRFAQLMNDLERNNMKFPTVSFDDLFNYLSKFEKLVNTSRAKKLEKSHDHLALVAHTGSSSRNTSSYYVTHPPSIVDYDEEFEQDDVHNHSEDPLASAMLLLAKAITQNFSNPTNNPLRALSNTINQAIVQGDRVNIQSKNSGLFELRLQAILQQVNAITTIEKDIMKGIVPSQGHMLLMLEFQPADQNSDDEPSYESAFVSEVQSSSINENDEQMYPTHTKIINSTIDDDQINSNIQFDSVKGNVNSGSVLKKDNTSDERAKRFQKQADSQLYRDREIIRDLEKQRDELSQEEKLKKNVDMFLKIGNSLQAMFMLGPKPLSVYDQQLKHGLGYPNPYTLRQAISECPKLYVASRTGNIEIPLNVRDSEETCRSSFKKIQKLEDENVSLDFKVQSLIKERDNAKMEYKKLFDSIKKTRSQTQKVMDELITHVSEKSYAYGAIRAENQNLLVTISELNS